MPHLIALTCPRSCLVK